MSSSLPLETEEIFEKSLNKELFSQNESSFEHFNFFLTLFLTLILWAICTPFFDKRSPKIILSIVGIILLHVSPLINYLLWTGTWAFGEKSFGKIHLLPVEEMIFFAIQTLFVSLWTFLCMRWQLPHVLLISHEEDKIKDFFKKWTPVLGAGIWFVFSLPEITTLVTEKSNFYICCLLTWSLPLLSILWIGASSFILKQKFEVLLSLILPTIYFTTLKFYSIRNRSLVIKQNSTLDIKLFNILNIEEILFLFLLNLTIILTYCALVRTFTVQIMCRDEKILNSFITKFIRSFFRKESDLDQEPIRELQTDIQLFKRASKSFWAGSLMFPPDMRHDLTVIYSFCRITDDMVDDLEISIAQKRKNLKIIREYLDQLFSDRTVKDAWGYTLKKESSIHSEEPIQRVDWNYFKGVLTEEEYSVFRALSRIASYLPPQPFYELCNGFEWDIESSIVQSEYDAVKYGENVAGSVAVLCIYLMLAKSDRIDPVKGLDAETHEEIVDFGRKTGISLQLTNIARDIITDSVELGRCYVPLNYFKNPEHLNKLLKRDYEGIDNEDIRNLALRVLNLADSFKKEGEKGLKMLPREARASIYCATEIYTGIGNVIRGQNIYPRVASVSKFRKILIALRCIYLPNSFNLSK